MTTAKATYYHHKCN